MNTVQPEGYLAWPAENAGRGVLVLHAWWGLNDTMKEFCDRLAEAGLVAFAPDLYHGKVVATIPEAEAMVQALNADYEQAQAEVAEAAEYLSERLDQEDGRGLAVVGFSLGASYAMDLAAAEPERIRSVVLFYGLGGGDFSASRAAYLGHFAENDPFETPEGVAEMEAYLKGLGRPVTFYTYPDTGHWFCEPDRPDAFNEPAAELAWQRTLSFLQDAESTER